MRRARASDALQKYDEALADVERVLAVEPAHREAVAMRPRLQTKRDEQLEELKACRCLEMMWRIRLSSRTNYE